MAVLVQKSSLFTGTAKPAQDLAGDKIMNEYGLYIDGQWVPSSSGRSFRTRTPATGEVLATFAEGT